MLGETAPTAAHDNATALRRRPSLGRQIIGQSTVRPLLGAARDQADYSQSDRGAIWPGPHGG
jgi:hypothetical protein